jgi:hypothetical protein
LQLQFGVGIPVFGGTRWHVPITRNLEIDPPIEERSSMIMPKRLGGSMLMLKRRGSMIMLKRLGSMMIMLKRRGFNDHAEEFMTGRHCWKIHGYVFCCNNPQYAT